MMKQILTFITFFFFAMLHAQKPFKGGEIYSKNKVLYGKFEVRMKMIKGSGMLSTFYTIVQNGSGTESHWSEIDIEVLGKENAQIMSTNIFINDSNGNLLDTSEEIHSDNSLADDFHTYIVEWTPSYVAWFLDGKEVRRKRGAFIDHMNIPQRYGCNAWVSSSPGWVGDIDRTAMPAYQYIDWMEYSSFDGPTQSFTKEWRDDFDTFDSARWSKANWTFDGNQVDFVSENAYIENGNMVLAITDRDPILSSSNTTIQNDFLIQYEKNSDELSINYSKQGVYSVVLYEITGKEVFSQQNNTSSISIPCSQFQKGMYIMNIHTHGAWSRQKIVIK